MEGDQDGEQPPGENGSSIQSSATSQQQLSSTPQVQQIPVVGPRHAPPFSVVNALMDKKEDGPGPRCGHTLTAVSPVGEEGTPGYSGSRLILFGGATALEGNSAASGTPTPPAGNVGIRLAGATADVHCYDVLTNKWSRVTPLGEPPTPRAAHVATAVGTMVVIQGGIGPAGLSSEDLHVLDLTQQRPRWHRVVVQGPGTGSRYGHVMALVGQRYLMVVGGNDGKRPLTDVWALDTAAKPYEWRKLDPEGEGPPPCMYATASARSDGLLLLCGGRDANSVGKNRPRHTTVHQPQQCGSPHEKGFATGEAAGKRRVANPYAARSRRRWGWRSSSPPCASCARPGCAASGRRGRRLSLSVFSIRLSRKFGGILVNMET